MASGGFLNKLQAESPKVVTLLVFGALVLFPMYMMIAISFMTPAQVERFPWFPVPVDLPESVDAPREGDVSVEPSALTLRPHGGPAVGIDLPADERFRVHLPGRDGDASWEATGSPTEPTTVAELQTAGVWDVQRTDADGQWRIDGRAFALPQQFESLLPGLELKARAQREMRIVDECLRRTRAALRASDRVSRAQGDEELGRFQREAVSGFLEADAWVDAAEKAMARAEASGRAAQAMHVSASDALGAARTKLRIAQLNRERLHRRVEPYLAGHRAAASEEVEAPDTAAVSELDAFTVDRGETVAVLLVDAPTRVTAQAGRVSVHTHWRYPVNRRRPLRVVLRPGVDPTDPEGRPAQPGQPLADLVAARDLTLHWADGAWWLEGMPLREHVPSGFGVRLPVPPETAGQSESTSREVAAGAVFGTLLEPVVAAMVSGGTLRVGLAVQGDEGELDIPLGVGRWSYSLRSERDTPFAVRVVAPADSRIYEADEAGSYRIRPDYRGPLAELVVNRQRTLIYDRATAPGTWVEQEERVKLVTPPGFVRQFDLPTDGEPQEKVFAGGHVLAELDMPEARVIVDEGLLVVRMTGGGWTGGQWEFAIGEDADLAPLQFRPASALGDDGAETWSRQGRDSGHGSADGEAASEAVLEVRAIRKTRLTYERERWRLDGRPVGLWREEEELRRARQLYDDAATRHRNLERRLAEVEEELASLQSGVGIAGNEAARELRDRRDDVAADLQAVREELEAARRRLDPLERVAAFLPLTGGGEPLSATQGTVVVEPGTVLARMVAEAPVDGGGPVETRLEREDETLHVRFTHRLPVPVQASVIVTEGERVHGRQSVARFFRPLWLDMDNYREAWVYVKPFILNTVVVAVTTMVLSLLFASLSAFVFARFQFPGKALLYSMIIVLLMIPGVLNLVPLYVVVKNMGLLNSLLALILPAIAGGQVTNIYIMRNNLETLAKDLFDAAKIDGASNLQTYWHIAVPLSKPIMGTLGIFALLAQWNNFIWPWIVLRDMDKMTITAGLAKLEGQHLSDYGLQMAGAVLASLPLIILFFFMMNLFIRGMQSGAIKA